ncbi:MAG: class I SAM-dependent methyltransferase [Candidatus Firestonebacteria bacterium]|nr:class I SAM-dependent methyltransferase [Candidatus Firestonebacteria bacterium]
MELGITLVCPVCGGSGLVQRDVLWPGLIAEWGLNSEEAGRISRQQGECCLSCGSNLRSRTLAGGLLECLNRRESLQALTQTPPLPAVRLLEINQAGTLTPYLRRFPNYCFAAYPELDMQHMDLPAESFDFIIHSDTLEHLPDPVAGLRECRRVLSPAGCLLLTIPVVPTRLTRRRQGLPPSYHGNPAEKPADQIVWSEYGADFYLDFIAAGWTKISCFTLGTPDSLAVIANK